MTKLLVSVRDATEAGMAVEAGAHLIDVKEPRRGSLGAAEAKTIEDVIASVDGRVPISAALGELLDPSPALSAVNRMAGPLHFAKFGLAGCAAVSNWFDRWQSALDALPAKTVRVAVIYADWRTAAAPEPDDVLQRATSAGCGAVLLDTFDKSFPTVTEQWSLASIHQLIRRVRSLGLVAVVAGRLTLNTAAVVASLGPDYVAVRGAVCDGDRTGRLNPERITRLVNRLNQESQTPSPSI